MILPYPLPQAPTAAYACRAEVNKWPALVRLLLSDVPERIKPGASLKLYLLSQAPIAAYAFRAEVNKWLALGRLPLSDVPERIKPGASLTLSLLSQAPIAAYAFRAEVNKWLALVRLLLSDVPERTELTAPGLATALAPYFHLTNAVRIGDLNAFQCVLS